MNLLDYIPEWVIVWAILFALLLIKFVPSETLIYNIGY